MKNRRLVLFLLISFILSFFFFKDALLYGLLQRSAKNHFSVFSAEKLIVWPNFFEVRGLELKTVPGAPCHFSLKGADAVIKVSPLLVSRRSLLFVSAGRMVLRDLQCGSFSLRRLDFNLIRDSSGTYSDSRLKIDALSFQDKQIKNLEGVFVLYPDFIILQHVDFQGVGGNITSVGRIDFKDGVTRLDVKIHLENIEIGELMRVLGMEKRVDAAGLFTGDILLVLKGGRLEALGGGLKSVTGGKFIMLDTSLMDKGMAPGPVANIVVENLKNYYYDIGYIDLQNEQQGIKMNVRLEGQAGNRQLEIVWHGGVS